MTKLGEGDREAVRTFLAPLAHDVDVLVETGPAAEPVSVITASGDLDFNAAAVELVREVAALSDRVHVDVREHRDVGRFPAITVAGELRFFGLPWGYELSSLVGAIAAAGSAEPALSDPAAAALAGLERDVDLEVWVTPT